MALPHAPGTESLRRAFRADVIVNRHGGVSACDSRRGTVTAARAAAHARWVVASRGDGRLLALAGGRAGGGLGPATVESPTAGAWRGLNRAARGGVAALPRKSAIGAKAQDDIALYGLVRPCLFRSLDLRRNTPPPKDMLSS
ncbi:hypothetical protein AcV5_006668 [Taiwanofungus camphoratus]|nr:hypothetical protein AcV5_006668 [Antrodia cinnamomea]